MGDRILKCTQIFKHRNHLAVWHVRASQSVIKVASLDVDQTAMINSACGKKQVKFPRSQKFI